MRRPWIFAAICFVALGTSSFGQGGRGAGASGQAPARDVVGLPPGQQGPTGTAILSGRIVYADSGRPARRARVGLSGVEPRLGKSVTADDQGRFEFANLPAGQFNLTASKPGFLEVTYGQKRPGSSQPGTPIRLLDGQRLENITLGIVRGGVITGAVVDDLGEPSFGTNVRVMRYVMRTGERVLQSAGSATTDDRGMYRIPSLVPGDYVVIATPRPGDEMAIEDMMMRAEQVAAAAKAAGAAGSSMLADMKIDIAMASSASNDNSPSSGYAPVYFPGTMIPSGATTVTVGIGEERAGVDFQLQLVPMAGVSGQLMSTDGQLVPAQLQLINQQALAGMGVRSTRSGADGRFSFSGVPPGQYTIVARMSVPMAPGEKQLPPGVELQQRLVMTTADGQTIVSGRVPGGESQMLWGTTEVATDGRPLSNVAIALRPGVAFSGSVSFEGAAPPPQDLTRLRVTLIPASQPGGVDLPLPSPTVVDRNGRFTFAGVIPGRYRVNLGGAPPVWKLKSAIVNGRDALDFPVEVKAGEDIAGAVITMADKPTDLSGVLQDASGKPTSDFTIVIFPGDTRYWLPLSRRIQATRPSTDGRFSFRDLPAGDYRLIAVTEVETGQWFDPNFLRQIAGAAMTISLNEGERKQQDIRVAR